MLAELVLSLLTINSLMKTTSTQYYSNPYGNQYYENMPQQYYQEQPEPEDIDYEDHGSMDHEHTRRSGRYKNYGSSGGKLPSMDYEYDRSEECKCSCNRCRNTYRPPKPCCKEVCNSCSEQQNQHDQLDQQGQGGVVFVPYPYPLMVPNLINNQTTTTKTTTSSTKTTTTTTTTTEKAIAIDSSEPADKGIVEPEDNASHANNKRYRRTSAETINDLILRSNNLKSDKKYILTTMRKTKPTWEPKYNIVPIPDNLAAKLMSQMRQVRELQTRRF